MIRLLHGDCVELLKSLADASVDAIVTDPPYGLGFMGKEWDRCEQDWHLAWAREALRVLKPGGHLVAFGGTRTYHRLVCAVEDGGFEIRDSLHWLYGCLTADAEILTAKGWRRGIDVDVGDVVAAWDSTTGHVLLQPVEVKTVAPWSGPLIRFANDDTDQLLTPNHRVYHLPRQRRMEDGKRRAWYGDRYEVAAAGSINRWSALKLPVAGIHEGPGIGGVEYAALLGWIWTEGGLDKAPSTGGAVADRVRADLPEKHPSWTLLWRMTADEKRAFWNAAMKGDGSGDDFYQRDRADLEWAQALVATIGMRGKIAMRTAPRDGGSLCVTPRDTTELQARHLRDAAEHYAGDVWCVGVASGAFIARRNGKVFITGNSGFPKSLDVSKAIDAKMLTGGSNSRGLKAANELRPGEGRVRTSTQNNGILGEDAGSKITRDEAATPEAAQWSGWGTALKPAHEPIVLARKPLDGTVASCVLAHGTGGLNIEACRVAGAARPVMVRTDTVVAARAMAGESTGATPSGEMTTAGRWPPNLLLSHLPSCERAGTRKVKGSSCTLSDVGKGREGNHTNGIYGAKASKVTTAYVEEDGTETVPAWHCAAGCPVAELDRQSGETTSGFMAAGTQRAGIGYQGGLGCIVRHDTHADSGGASRFFPTFEWDPELDVPFFYCAKAAKRERNAGLGDARNTHPTVKPIKLMRWLCKLVTPPGGLIVDPFLGSGTTGCAAIDAGFAFIGIEREAEYLEIAARRISHVAKRPIAVETRAVETSAVDDDVPVLE